MIDTSKFNAMCRELAVKANAPSDEVLVSEVGKILEAAIKYTPAAQVSRIRSASENAKFSMQPDSLYSPKYGRKGVNITKSGFIAYYLQNRYPNVLWNAISARRKASLLAKLRARGLSKRSWWQIAKQLGLNVSVPSFVTGAVATTGRQYPENTSTRIARQSGRLQVVIENSQPTVNLPRVGGARALQRAIDGRVKYFVQNVGRGVFDDATKIAKRYPGIKITN